MGTRDEPGGDETGRLEGAEPAAKRVGGDVEGLGELAVVQAIRLGTGRANGFKDQKEGEGLRPESPEALRPGGEDPCNISMNGP